MKLSWKLVVVFLFLFVEQTGINKFTVYRVVLDPGHGGVTTEKKSDGDRFDLISNAYLSSFNSGATYKKLKEEQIAYDISLKVKKILKNCSDPLNFYKFSKIAKKYTNDNIRSIRINLKMSRERSLTEENFLNSEDPNGKFRLFDYYDGAGSKTKGRISKINDFKPHMVVSIHMAHSAPREYKGLSPVLVAPFRLLNNGLSYMRGSNQNRDFFYNSKLKHWFIETTRRTAFNWMINDTSLYFTGYPLNSDGSIKLNKFRGYRYNMVTWNYADDKGWQNKAILHKENSKYSMDFKNISSTGKFWDRERSKFESYRRDYGEEGFGGDNSYASYEIIRYILYSLKIDGKKFNKVTLGKPYVSVWSMPLLVNAINPYIELGYFNRKKDRYMLTKKQDEVAEGIAMGIYSLLTGINIKSNNISYKPKGKKLDFNKYRIDNKSTYFDEVVN